MSGKAEILRKKVDQASRSEQQRAVTPVKACPNKNWIELFYKYNNNEAVSFANYKVFTMNNEELASGKLDQMGFARVEGLPDGVTNVKFSFSSDPLPYKIFPKYQPKLTPSPPPDTTPVQVKDEDGAVVSAAKWVWGVVQGDFNEDQSFGQIAFGSALTLIPYIDQAGDARDLSAAYYKLVVQKKYEDISVWADLVFTIIGCVPEVGTVVKGVLKAMVNAGAQGAAKVIKAIHLDKLMKSLNKAGQGDVPRFLRELIGKLPELGRQAEKKILEMLSSMKETLSLVKRIAAGKAKRMAEIALEGIREVAKRVSGKVVEVIEAGAKKLQELIDEVVDYVLEGATRRKNGAKQLVGEFPPPLKPALDLQKTAAAAGMEMREVQALQKHCQKNGQRIIVRGTNKAGLKYHNVPGYVPKPLDVKLKGAKTGESAGLVVRPKEPMKDWEMQNIEELEKKGYKFDQKGVLIDPNGNYIYSDYDLQAVHREVTDETGKKVFVQEIADDDAVKEINDSIGLNRPGQKGKPVQHGAENDFRVKKDKDGKPVMASDDDINKGNTKLGRQYGEDETYLVVNPDGSTEVLNSPAELHNLYRKPGDELPWEYDATPAKSAPAN